MRIIFSVLGLLVVVAIVGVLAKKQLTGVGPRPASDTSGVTLPSGGTPKQQVEQVQKSIQDAVQQAPRTTPDDTK